MELDPQAISHSLVNRVGADRKRSLLFSRNKWWEAVKFCAALKDSDRMLIKLSDNENMSRDLFVLLKSTKTKIVFVVFI